MMGLSLSCRSNCDSSTNSSSTKQLLLPYVADHPPVIVNFVDAAWVPAFRTADPYEGPRTDVINDRGETIQQRLRLARRGRRQQSELIIEGAAKRVASRNPRGTINTGLSSACFPCSRLHGWIEFREVRSKSFHQLISCTSLVHDVGECLGLGQLPAV